MKQESDLAVVEFQGNFCCRGQRWSVVNAVLVVVILSKPGYGCENKLGFKYERHRSDLV